MTPIELEAALLLQGSPARKGFPITYDISRAHAIEALCSLIERHEAFRQEVSEAVAALNYKRWSGDGLSSQDVDDLVKFIIPGPVDPFDKAFDDAVNSCRSGDSLKDALRKALAARGLKIVEADNAA